MTCMMRTLIYIFWKKRQVVLLYCFAGQQVDKEINKKYQYSKFLALFVVQNHKTL